MKKLKKNNCYIFFYKNLLFFLLSLKIFWELSSLVLILFAAVPYAISLLTYHPQLYCSLLLQALLTFWFHVCINCEDNIKFITETPEVCTNIAYNYIL